MTRRTITLPAGYTTTFSQTSPRSVTSKSFHARQSGIAELDKSGIAELTFKDRHKQASDRV